MERQSESPLAIDLPGEGPGAGTKLAGLYGGLPKPRGGALVAAPHPLMGGTMDSPVVSEIVASCRQSGIASLRFDWRGVGGSQGTASGDIEPAEVDFRAAFGELAARAPRPLFACGYSFGAMMALAASQRLKSVDRLILVAPPISLLDLTPLTDFAGAIFVAAAEHDEWVDQEPLARVCAEAPSAHFALIADCDHFFAGGTAALGAALASWLDSLAAASAP